MTRLARIVVPGVPHYITQGGNRDLEVFFGEADYQHYLADVAAACAKAGTAVWAYCLLPDRVHFILLPQTADGLRAALAEPHRRHARRINQRQGWNGHLWQERFQSFPLDESRLGHVARYVEQSPLRAGMARRAEAWLWSSARAHMAGADDRLVEVAPLLAQFRDWRLLLAASPDDATLEALQSHARSGRPFGPPRFVAALERQTGRPLTPRKRGRPRKQAAND